MNISELGIYMVGTHDNDKNQNTYILKSKVKDTLQSSAIELN